MSHNRASAPLNVQNERFRPGKAFDQYAQLYTKRLQTLRPLFKQELQSRLAIPVTETILGTSQ